MCVGECVCGGWGWMWVGGCVWVGVWVCVWVGGWVGGCVGGCLCVGVVRERERERESVDRWVWVCCVRDI